jgi:uncharacterized protein
MKKILITGASEGIGLEAAVLLAEQGNQITLVSRNKGKLEKAVSMLGGEKHGFLVADLSRKEDAHRVADHISENHYDLLINNAGIGMYGRFEEMQMTGYATMMNLNMTGLTLLSLSFLKNAKKGDCLVNVASTLASTSFPGLAVYAATKAYVLSFSESLWWENKKRGVYVLGFCPGVTRTKFHESSGGSYELFPQYISQTPRQVAIELIHALRRQKKPKTVSGAMNRFMLFFQRFLSRKMIVNMMGGFSPLSKSVDH